MRFKDYMNESVDVDPSKIDITNDELYQFEFDGKKYQVVFRDYPGLFSSCKSIEFKGPRGCMPTGLSRYKASQVYGIMLSAVIAYIEKYSPKGLDFYGANDTMDLLYKRFADRYAKDEPGKPADRVYFRLSDSQWLRKDVYESLDPYNKGRVEEMITKWNRMEAGYLQQKRQEGNMRRNLFIKYKPYLGGFILYKEIDWGVERKFWYILKDVDSQGYFKVIFANEVYSQKYAERSLRINDNMTFITPDELNSVPMPVLKAYAEILMNNDAFKSLPNDAYDKIIQAANSPRY